LLLPIKRKSFNFIFQATSSSEIQTERKNRDRSKVESSSTYRKKKNVSLNDKNSSSSPAKIRTRVAADAAVTTEKYDEDSVIRRLKRAATRASAEAAEKKLLEQQHSSSSPSPLDDSDDSNNNRQRELRSSLNNNNNNNNSARQASSSNSSSPLRKNLLDLMQLIDEELRQNRHHHHVRGMMVAPQSDSMGAILTHNLRQEEEEEQENVVTSYNGDRSGQELRGGEEKSRRSNKMKSIRDVAVLLAKPLQHDDITFEGAGRIRLLVKLIKDNHFRPDLICFVGGTTGSHNHVADADASYLFFRHLCQSQRVLAATTVPIFLARQSIDQDALEKIVQHIQQQYLTDWKQEHTAVLTLNSASDKDIETRLPRKRLHIRFSLISSEYELCQLNDIHTRSPSQSPLRVLNTNLLPTSWVKTSWTYHYTTTATAFSDPVRSFAAKTYKTAQDLVPVLKNLRGVVDNREFFQRDNYRVLVAARRSLVSDMENMYHKQPSLQSVKQVCFTSTENKPLDVVLEGALLGLGRCLDLVRPAGLLTGSVPREEFRRALHSLQQAYYLLDRACDPDEPLDPVEWGKLGFGSGGSSSDRGGRNFQKLEDGQVEREQVPFDDFIDSNKDDIILDELIIDDKDENCAVVSGI